MLRPVPLALAFLLLVLLMAQPAHAASPTGWEFGRAAAVAAKVWQGQIPCDRLAVVLDAPGTLAPDGSPTDGLWGYVLTNADGTLAEPCTIHLTPALQAQGWPAICTVVMHEGGHLAGRPHAAHGLMAPSMEAPDPRCGKRGRPTLGLPEPRSAADRFKYARVSGI